MDGAGILNYKNYLVFTVSLTKFPVNVSKWFRRTKSLKIISKTFVCQSLSGDNILRHYIIMQYNIRIDTCSYTNWGASENFRFSFIVYTSRLSVSKASNPKYELDPHNYWKGILISSVLCENTYALFSSNI